MYGNGVLDQFMGCLMALPNKRDETTRDFKSNLISVQHVSQNSLYVGHCVRGVGGGAMGSKRTN